MNLTKDQIKKVATKFKDVFPEYKTPEGAKGKSLEACVLFLHLMGIASEDMTDLIVSGQRSKGGVEPVEEHFLVRLGTWYVDPTARQYREDAPFPMMWEYPILRKN